MALSSMARRWPERALTLAPRRRLIMLNAVSTGQRGVPGSRRGGTAKCPAGGSPYRVHPTFFCEWRLSEYRPDTPATPR